MFCEGSLFLSGNQITCLDVEIHGFIRVKILSSHHLMDFDYQEAKIGGSDCGAGVGSHTFLPAYIIGFHVSWMSLNCNDLSACYTVMTTLPFLCPFSTYL